MDTLEGRVEIAGAGSPLPLDTLPTACHFSAATDAHVGRRITGSIGDLHRELSWNDPVILPMADRTWVALRIHGDCAIG